MTILRRKLQEILTKIQSGSSTQIQIKRLQNLYLESKFEDFLKEFLRCINIILKMMNDTDIYRDKLLVFVSKFCTSLKKPTDELELLCPFLKEIFLHLFKEHDPERISTFRVCQLIKLLLSEIGAQESFLDEDICDQIRDIMIERLDDSKARVRIQAIEVLQRLQNPLDNNDEIIKSFIDRLSDDNSQVRKHIVQCIGVNVVTIPVIVGRCLDVSEEVRLGTYDKLSKIPIKALKIAQRQFILRNGFSDKCKKIQNFILKTLLPQWLSTYNGNYFQLIRALKLDADDKDFKQTTTLLEKILKLLFKNTAITTIMEALPLGKEKLIYSEKVQWEEILFWRCLENFLREQENENDYVDKILPELIFFCDYVQNVYTSKIHLKSEWDVVQHDHIMLELLKISHDYDYSEEVGRNALQNLLSTILIDGPALYEVTELLVKMFEKLVPDIEERATKFCEIIAEIQTPLVPVAPSEDMVRRKNVKLAEFRCRLNIAEDRLETAIEKEDYDKASELKKDIASIKEKMTEFSNEFENTNVQRTQKTDTSTLCRCLDILTASLKNPKIKSLPGPYRAFQDIFLPPLLSSRQPEVFWKALKQLCLFANFDLKLAKESMKVFCAPLVAHKFRPVYGDQTTIIAIMCITDIILIHGSDVFEEEDIMLNASQKPTNKRKILDQTAIDETVCPEPRPLSLEQVMEILSELLDDTDDKVREIAAECLITTIMTGRIRSPLLFSKLLLKWFSPNTLKDVRLRQFIGRLFTDYVPESRCSLEVIEQAFVPTLRAIIDAPKNSPLADVDVDSVSRFLATLSLPGQHKYNVGLDAHKNIALKLCKEICDHPNTKHGLVYLKTLRYLEAPREDEAVLDMLRKQVDIMEQIVKEKNSLRYVYKYRHKLDSDITQTDNTASAISVNSVTNIPDNTVSSVVTETPMDSVIIENAEIETNRYSTLSIKRKKRMSKENVSVQALNGTVPSTTTNDIVVRIDRNSEIEKICTRMVMSETDSEFATDNETLENKKKKYLCAIRDRQITDPLILNEDEIEICTVQDNPSGALHNSQEPERVSINNQHKSKPEKELFVRLERNNKIEQMMCSLTKDTSISEKQLVKSVKKTKINLQKQLKVILVRHKEIKTSKINTTESKCDAETNTRQTKKNLRTRQHLDRNAENDKIYSSEVKTNNKTKRTTRQRSVLLEQNTEIEKNRSSKTISPRLMRKRRNVRYKNK